MAKRPLRVWMRDKLLNQVKEMVVPAREKRAVDAAYERAFPLVVAIVGKKFPPKDMALLEKYGVACHHESANIQGPNGQVVSFTFAKANHVAVPQNTNYRHIFLADAATLAAVEKHNAATIAFTKERDRRIQAFRTLLSSAAYVEDVTDVWPEAAAILPATQMTAPIAPEDIAIIKSDMRERAAA